MKTKSQIQNIITQHLSEGWEFVVDSKLKIENWHLEGAQQAGYLNRIFRLSSIRLWISGNENSDFDILEVLDSLVRNRRLVIHRIQVTREMEYSDSEFISELGVAICEPMGGGVHGWKFPYKNFYWNRPYKRLARGHTKGVRPLSTVLAMHKKRDEFLRQKFGGESHEAEIFKEHLHDDIMANIEEHNLLVSIDKKLDKLGEKE